MLLQCHHYCFISLAHLLILTHTLACSFFLSVPFIHFLMLQLYTFRFWIVAITLTFSLELIVRNKSNLNWELRKINGKSTRITNGATSLVHSNILRLNVLTFLVAKSVHTEMRFANETRAMPKTARIFFDVQALYQPNLSIHDFDITQSDRPLIFFVRLLAEDYHHNSQNV